MPKIFCIFIKKVLNSFHHIYLCHFLTPLHFFILSYNLWVFSKFSRNIGFQNKEDRYKIPFVIDTICQFLTEKKENKRKHFYHFVRVRLNMNTNIYTIHPSPSCIFYNLFCRTKANMHIHNFLCLTSLIQCHFAGGIRQALEYLPIVLKQKT